MLPCCWCLDVIRRCWWATNHNAIPIKVPSGTTKGVRPRQINLPKVTLVTGRLVAHVVLVVATGEVVLEVAPMLK